MDLDQYDKRMAAMLARAHGHWTAILEQLGASKELLGKKNLPCPIEGCGGTDRFQYTDAFGDGNYHCRHCGAGGGFKLAQNLIGNGSPERAGVVLRQIELLLGIVETMPAAPPGPDSGWKRVQGERIWNEARPIVSGDAVDRYLRKLGINLDAYPDSLRCHRQLPYYEKDFGAKKARVVGTFPAMVARLTGPDGRAAALHRTYLLDDAKAPVPAPKKMIGDGYDGAAVRFGEPKETLAAGEGIENCLAVLKRTGSVTWAACNAGNLEKLWVPPTVELLKVYGDNDADADFTGQAAAYILARNFVRSGKKAHPHRAEVNIPRAPGADWKQVLRQQSLRSAA